MNVREQFRSPAFTNDRKDFTGLAAFVNEMNAVNAFSESFTSSSAAGTLFISRIEQPPRQFRADRRSQLRPNGTAWNRRGTALERLCSKLFYENQRLAAGWSGWNGFSFRSTLSLPFHVSALPLFAPTAQPPFRT